MRKVIAVKSTRTLLIMVELILADLDAAETIDHMRQPGYRLHELKGDLYGFYAVDVSGNWRVVFRFEDGQASDINLVDYH
jgi:toxin HigB-1